MAAAVDEDKEQFSEENEALLVTIDQLEEDCAAFKETLEQLKLENNSLREENSSLEGENQNLRPGKREFSMLLGHLQMRMV